jgi:hypothetical protein
MTAQPGTPGPGPGGTPVCAGFLTGPIRAAARNVAHDQMPATVAKAPPAPPGKSCGGTNYTFKNVCFWTKQSADSIGRRTSCLEGWCCWPWR